MTEVESNSVLLMDEGVHFGIIPGFIDTSIEHEKYSRIVAVAMKRSKKDKITNHYLYRNDTLPIDHWTSFQRGYRFALDEREALEEYSKSFDKSKILQILSRELRNSLDIRLKTSEVNDEKVNSINKRKDSKKIRSKIHNG
jgi:hypothetical protein